MKNDELVIVDVNSDYTSVWAFCDAENAMETIARAQKNAAETVATYESHIINYPDRADYWRSCKAKYENAKYEVMTFNEFLDRQRKSLTGRDVIEITEDRYFEMFNCLPPYKWCTIDGVEMFCISEMYTGTYTDQYARIGDKFYSAMVDVTDKSTWIHERLKKSIA